MLLPVLCVAPAAQPKDPTPSAENDCTAVTNEKSSNLLNSMGTKSKRGTNF
jgi:hypothetical protein